MSLSIKQESAEERKKANVTKPEEKRGMEGKSSHFSITKQK
jgi:hypothetical protein